MSNPVNVQLLQELRDGQRGIVWLQGLAQSNVRRSDGALGEQAYELAGQIDRLDEEIQDTYVEDRFFFPLPRAWWFWVPALYLCGFLFAAQTEVYEDRLMRWMWSLVFWGAFGIYFLIQKKAMEESRKRQKSQQRPRLKGERAALMVRLLETRDALIHCTSTEPAESES